MCLRKSLKYDFCGIQSEARHEFAHDAVQYSMAQ